MLSLTWGGNHGTPEQRWAERKKSFPRMPHFPEASLLAVLLFPLLGPLAHDLSAFSFQQVSQILLRQEESPDWLTAFSSTGVDLSWNFKMWLYYYSFFFSFTVLFGDTWAFGASKKRKLRGLFKSRDDWCRHLVLQPTKTINHVPKQGGDPVVHFPSDAPIMISGHQNNSKLFQAEVVKNGNGQ